MSLIQDASERIRSEHSRKLAELDPQSLSGVNSIQATGDPTADFEALLSDTVDLQKGISGF